MSQLEEFNQHRGLLFSIAYNMLGTVMDAEDMLQETYLRLQDALERGTQVRSVKDFCARIITNLCLDYSKSASVQRETYIGPWLPQPIVQPYPNVTDQVEKADALSMAFLTILEKLSPLERAVLIMRKVFDYEYNDIARTLDKSEAACRQLMSRAQKHIDDEQVRFEADLAEQERLTQQFVQMVATGDIAELVNMMVQDAVQVSDGGGKAYAALKPIYGAEKMARFWVSLMKFYTDDTQLRPALVNGQYGVILYDKQRPFCVIAPYFVDGKIARIFSVLNPDKLDHLPNLDANN